MATNSHQQSTSLFFFNNSCNAAVPWNSKFEVVQTAEVKTRIFRQKSAELEISQVSLFVFFGCIPWNISRPRFCTSSSRELPLVLLHVPTDWTSSITISILDRLFFWLNGIPVVAFRIVSYFELTFLNQGVKMRQYIG